MIRKRPPGAWLLCTALAVAALSGCLTTGSDRGAPLRNDRSAELQTDPASPLAGLLPVNRLSGEFVLHQIVTVRWSVEGEAFEESFNAALQRRGETLLLLGLGPLGRVGFELRLEGGEVHFENRTGRLLPFEPENILADVQRVFYPWTDEPVQCSHCQREGKHRGISILETYGASGLVERRFSFADAPDRGEVIVRYGADRLSRAIPTRADLQNDWVGYSLVIETHRFDPIESR
jgi:hypothetical protein